MPTQILPTLLCEQQCRFCLKTFDLARILTHCAYASTYVLADADLKTQAGFAVNDCSGIKEFLLRSLLRLVAHLLTFTISPEFLIRHDSRFRAKAFLSMICKLVRSLHSHRLQSELKFGSQEQKDETKLSVHVGLIALCLVLVTNTPAAQALQWSPTQSRFSILELRCFHAISRGMGSDFSATQTVWRRGKDSPAAKQRTARSAVGKDILRCAAQHATGRAKATYDPPM